MQGCGLDEVETSDGYGYRYKRDGTVIDVMILTDSIASGPAYASRRMSL